MKHPVFFGILVTYVVLLVSTGYLAFIRFPGLLTLPNQAMTEHAGRDTLFKEQLVKDVEAARDRREQLVKLASHSFDVVLGALLGFLSAVAATSGLTGIGRQSEGQSGASALKGNPSAEGK